MVEIRGKQRSSSFDSRFPGMISVLWRNQKDEFESGKFVKLVWMITMIRPCSVDFREEVKKDKGFSS